MSYVDSHHEDGGLDNCDNDYDVDDGGGVDDNDSDGDVDNDGDGDMFAMEYRYSVT